MPPADIDQRRRFLARECRKRGCRPGFLRHYTDVTDIEPGILPLVEVLNSPFTTPIFSCQGHWECQSRPYVRFLVLPGNKRCFRRLLNHVLNEDPPPRILLQFRQRLHPRVGPTGPFIDWEITLQFAPEAQPSAQAFARTRYRWVSEAARYLRRQFRWSEGR